MEKSLSHAEFIKRKNDRQLTYSEFGDPDGKAVFFFHGWPGARLQGAMIDSSARALGLRIIAPDRPGFGLSDYQPGRSILDWPSDVTELADQLGMDRFAVLGLSGGAPYALACAFKIPPRLIAVSLVSGIGPSDSPGAAEGVSPQLRRLIHLCRIAPWFVRIMLWRSTRKGQKDPEGAFASLLSSLPEPDQNALSQPGVKEMAWAARADSYRAGCRGHYLEIRLFARPWGFQREEIEIPIHLWHGEEDRDILLITAQRQTEALPECRSHFLPGEGHYSLYINRHKQILEDLIP